jgi:protein-L-isoaspartate O-methyltransferase
MSKYHRLLKRAISYTPYELFLQKRAQMHTRMAVSTIDIDGLKEIRKTARQHSPSIMDLKYFDVDHWIQDSLYRAFKLNLHNSRGKSILDIGTGFGYFPYIGSVLVNVMSAIAIGATLVVVYKAFMKK